MQRQSTNKGAAVVVWLLGAYTTASFIREIGVADPVSFFIGTSIQFLLTKMEAPLWRRGEKSKMAITALIFDCVLTSAGVWPYLRNLGNTAFWVMMSEWLGSDGAPSLTTRIVISVVVGIITAAGPEILWEQED